MPPETTTPTTPNAAMASFITGLQQAGMDQAVTETAKETTPPPNEGKDVKQSTNSKADNQRLNNPPIINSDSDKGKDSDGVGVPQPESEEDKWPRSAKDWDSFKAKRKERESALAKERDTIKSERDKLNTEIATLRKSGPSPELDGLKKERDELSERLRIVAVEQHPKFKAYFEGKTNEQIELAKDIVGNGKSDDIVTLLKQPDSQWRRARLEELTADLSTMQQSQLAGVMLNLSTINRERQGAIAGAKETYEKMVKDQQEAAMKQATEAKAGIEKLFNSALERAQDPKKGISPFQIREGDDAWNEGVQQRINTAKAMLFEGVDRSKVDPVQAMDALLMGIAAPAILGQLNSALEENTKLQAQIKELSTATPTLQTAGTTGSTGTEQPPVVIKPGMNPHDAAKAFMMGLHQAGQ